MTSKTLIILLTHNRPKILKRCISSSIKHSKIASNSCWIIIDDSSSDKIRQNSDILADFVNSGLEIIHITESKRTEIFQIISTHTSNKDCEIIFEKSYHRDISGFRNLGLFLNFILKSDLTFFIDDDMVINNDSSTSEPCFFDYVQKTFVDSKNYVVGSTLMGILDESYIGRFAYLANHDMNSIFEQDKDLCNSDNDWNFDENPLWIDTKPSPEKYPTHTSAGLLGFKLNLNSVIPFPSGYNEDWIWCLLQTALHGTKINKTKLTAFHSPSSFFKPKQEGILWELMGECFFDFILHVIPSNNLTTLKDIETKIQTNDVINKKIHSLNSLLSHVESHVVNYSLIQKQELTQYTIEIKNARNRLENANMSSLVNLWFKDFNKRCVLFSSMLNDKFLCKRVENSLEFVKSTETILT